MDHAVGVVVQVKVGDEVAEGEPLCTIHTNGDERLGEAKRSLLDTYTFSDEPVPPPPLIHRVIK